MSENKKDTGVDGREIFGIGALCIGAFWYKYGFAIQVWFHENLVKVVLSGAAVLTLCGYIIVRRTNRKNEEEIQRMKRLSKARPANKSPDHYYQRRPRSDRHQERDHE